MNKPLPRSLTVLRSQRVSPSMHQITLGGPGLEGFPAQQEGGYVKLMLPVGGVFSKPVVRTYTIRAQRRGEIDVQFALHGGNVAGPATRWALEARTGDTIEVGGPGPAKPLPAGRDFYLVAGDMAALPAIAANLEALDRDARGVALLEIQDEADAVAIDAPEGVQIRWLLNRNPGHRPDLLVDSLRRIERPEGSLAAWVACEFSAMRAAREFLRGELGLGGSDLYISSYWKLGIDETQHKLVKREDSEALAA